MPSDASPRWNAPLRGGGGAAVVVAPLRGGGAAVVYSAEQSRAPRRSRRERGACAERRVADVECPAARGLECCRGENYKNICPL